MTNRRDGRRPGEEPENPVEELLEGLERTKWRPARFPWGATQRRRTETEERHEELMRAWRRRRTRAVPGEGGSEEA